MIVIKKVIYFCDTKDSKYFLCYILIAYYKF